MKPRHFDVRLPVKAMVVAVLLPSLLVVPAPAAQTAGSGNPPQRLTEHDLRAAFERAQQALAAEVEKQGDKIFGRLPAPAEPKQ